MPSGGTYSPEEFAAMLTRQGQAMLDVNAYVQDAFPKVIKLLQSQSRKAFHTESSPTGQAWPPTRWRARGSTGHTLRDKGTFAASMTGNTPESVQELNDTVITYGTSNKAGFHHAGGMIQRRNSKFLTLPASKEALYVGGMRNFPRKLNIVWDEARGKGIAYERLAKKPKKKRKSAKASGKARKAKKKSWLGKLLAKGKKAAKGFLKRLKASVKKKRKTRAKSAKKKSPSRSGGIMIHYYLRAWVLVPARPIFELNQQTHEKIGYVLCESMLKHMRTV